MIEKLLKEDVRLASPPAVAVRIIGVVKREDFSFSELGAIIQADPALSSKILRLVNSGFYGVRRNVSNIETAVAVLGANALKNIALSFVLTQTFQGKRGESFDFDRLWRRSITAAVAAQLISETVKIKDDAIFIASLLQDIGIGAMFDLMNDKYISVLEEKAVSGLPISAVERQEFGYDHQEVGAELLKKWGLPENVYLPIRFHHSPEKAPPALRTTCNILQASDRLSAIYHGTASARNYRAAKEILLKTFGLSDLAADNLIDAVAEKSAEVLAQFDLTPGKILPYSQILQAANEELSRINFSYEVLIVEHREAQEKAERLASQLRVANERLRHAAFHDGLTGLYNHFYFQETLARELNRAARHHHPLSLIMFDLDFFKRVNDTYGHQRGNAVLKAISEIIKTGVRASDVVARYGGEEFVILLPETNVEGAIIKAEACRAAIEAVKIQADGVVIQVTISLGIAAYDPAQPVSKETLVLNADQALYRSKNEGRNRATVWQ